MTPEERAHRICMEWYESEHFELEQLRVAIVEAIYEALAMQSIPQSNSPAQSDGSSGLRSVHAPDAPDS